MEYQSSWCWLVHFKNAVCVFWQMNSLNVKSLINCVTSSDTRHTTQTNKQNRKKWKTDERQALCGLTTQIFDYIINYTDLKEKSTHIILNLTHWKQSLKPHLPYSYKQILSHQWQTLPVSCGRLKTLRKQHEPTNTHTFKITTELMKIMACSVWWDELKPNMP